MDFIKKGINKLQEQHPMGGGGGGSHADDYPEDQLNHNERFERGDRTPVWPHPQGGEAPQNMPPKVANLDYRGKMRFFKPNGEPHNVMRDLGFSGVIDGKVVWCWGDTLMGTQKHGMICANDSTSIGSIRKPMTACDSCMKDGHVDQWIPPTDQEKHEGGAVRYGYGGTNIVEIAPNRGLVYYLKNDRKGGGGDIKGAGVALVHMEGYHPRAKRVHDILWGPDEPWYGDVGIQYDPRDKHVYAFGHGPKGDKELESRTFLCRCPAEEATNLQAYEYWDNEAKQWRKRRLTLHGENGTIKLNQRMAIFDWYNMNQSQPFWSPHFNKYMLLHGDSFGGSDVKCKTADHLNGPWQNHPDVAKTAPNPGASMEKAFRYCHTGHPWVDPSGKKVLVTWTRANWIWGVMITWE